MSEQNPEPVASETAQPAVEPEKTTNDLSQQDDVEVAEDQTPYPQPDAEDDGIRVLGQVGEATLYGHPAGVRFVDDPGAEQGQ